MGTAGLFSLVGRLPVMATQIMQGSLILFSMGWTIGHRGIFLGVTHFPRQVPAESKASFQYSVLRCTIVRRAVKS
jgi:hypothetical protein